MHRLLPLVLVLAAACIAAFAVDVAVLNWVRGIHLPSESRKLIELSEVFGHGIGIAAICLTMFVLDKEKRRCLPRLLACSLGAGITANVVKMMVARTRPRDHEFQSVWESFNGFLPGIAFDSGGLGSSIQSFPSGHSATAAGLAVGLSFLYPQGRVLFAVFACLAAVQRIEASAHFLSDTLAGAAVGCLFAACCIDPKLFGRWFDRFERGGQPAPESNTPNDPKK